MTAAATEPFFKRSRASERAITAALAAMKSAGLPVDKVCVNGGQIEIHVQHVEGQPEAQNDRGLKDW